MKARFLIFSIMVCFMQFLKAQTPQLYILDGAKLATRQKSYRQGNSVVVNEVKMVVKKADELLNVSPRSVMDKAFTPPSGSKHDYMSLAPYFWPDPTKPNGLPYVRKDGEHNPEIKKISYHMYLSELETRCEYLSLAYYFTGDEKYADKASQLIKVWFLNTDTKMNPNLDYAQAIRGVNDGRGIGIIETRALVNLQDWLVLLSESKSFSVADFIKVKNWYKQYLTWLQTSKNGTDESRSQNNHGTYYDAQLVGLALFTGDTQLAKRVLENDKKRIAIQIAPSGEQNLELARTNAYGYSTMNLNGWFNLANLGDKAGVDLWNYHTTDNRGIRKAVDYLMPYALDEKKKDHQQIGAYNKDEFYRILVLAYAKYKEDIYRGKAALLPKNDEVTLEDLID